MKVFASHDSALDYWRYHFSPDMEIGDPVRTNPSESYAYKKQDVLGCYPEWYVDPEKPVHVLVFDEKARRQSSRIACHLWSTDLPDGTFHGRGSFRVSSPEFLFLQMATTLTTVQGIIIPPVPSMGRISNTEISAAIKMLLPTPMMESPIESSTKVMPMIIR